MRTNQEERSMNAKRTLCLVATLLFVAGAVSAQEVFVDQRLTKVWETQPGLKTPESVLYDPSGNVIYVSNINDKPWEKDGNGFISKLTPGGELLALEWVKGLSAPKGMGIAGGRLYVTDVDELVEIDLAQARIVKRYGHPAAKNLNDVATAPDGAVFVSDSAGRSIYTLEDGRLEVLLESDAITKTNGLFVLGGSLLCGLPMKLVALDLATKAVTPFVDETGGIDGIAAVGDGSFVISDWRGSVQLVAPGQPSLKLLDTTSKGINAADIDFIPKDRTLLVPTFFDNRVVAYRLK
jgi:DNA-binding beta-propeller fold protein YncE